MAHTQLRTFHLFSGAGGGILADLLLGHLPVGACEIEKYPREVLLARQRDGILPFFPIAEDVCELDGKPWRESVDVLCGGFPCQDISSAGKGAGITGARSGLWKEYARLINEMRPRFVFAENSPLLRTRGLGIVLEDLAAMGYDARWGIMGAWHVGAPHKRDRMWVLAYDANANNSTRGSEQEREHEGAKELTGSCQNELDAGADLAYANSSRSRQDSSTGELRTSGTQQSSEDTGLSNQTERGEVSKWWHTDPADLADSEFWGCNGRADRASRRQRESEEALQNDGSRGRQEDGLRTTEPLVGRVANGVAHRVDRLKAIGNGQVPQCAALAFSILSEGLI